MRLLFSIANESFLRLRRDRIFLPILILGIFWVFLSSIMSDWGIEEFKKILFDFSTLGFELTGVSIAIFWGIKAINDSKGEGSIEVQLAAPISRTTWFLGKYLGLIYGLVLIAVILICSFQLILWFYGYKMFILDEIAIFLLIVLEWAVMGAVASFFATIGSQAIALFSTFSLWIFGLISAPIYNSIPTHSPDLTNFIVKNVFTYWDLGRFHIVSPIMQNVILTNSDFMLRGLYGLFLIGFFVSLGSLVLRNKDLTN